MEQGNAGIGTLLKADDKWASQTREKACVSSLSGKFPCRQTTGRGEVKKEMLLILSADVSIQRGLEAPPEAKVAATGFEPVTQGL